MSCRFGVPDVLAPVATLVLLVAGCAPVGDVQAPARSVATPSAQPPPASSPGRDEDAAAAAYRADDAIRLAYMEADPHPLSGALTGAALAVARRQAVELRRRGTRVEEVLDSRRVVHAGGVAGRPEVVLELRARRRLVSPGAPAPPLAIILRQWRAELEWTGGGWLVADAQDLAPPAWWQ
jgi:hypothetical protein